MSHRVASFIGWSSTGKTGFIEGCLRELADRGLTAGAVKCVHHRGSFNLPGKDTTRFFDAGASAAIIADDELVIVARPPTELDTRHLQDMFPGAVAVLVEGRFIEGAMRVLVGGSASTEPELKHPFAHFDALVSDDRTLRLAAVDAGLAVFGTSGYAEFVDTLIGGTSMEREVVVTNGGTEIPLNPFVKETFENVVLGLLKALKKTD
ncbi:MAG: hypothetical protein E4H20_11950, partial [Spirochaetales bacterium]